MGAGADRLGAAFAALGQEEQATPSDQHLDIYGTSTHTVMTELLSSLDVDAYLIAAGVTPGELARARHRMRE